MIRLEKCGEDRYYIEQFDGGVPYGGRVVLTSALPKRLMTAIFHLKFVAGEGILVDGTGICTATGMYELSDACLFGEGDDDEV